MLILEVILERNYMKDIAYSQEYQFLINKDFPDLTTAVVVKMGGPNLYGRVLPH